MSEQNPETTHNRMELFVSQGSGKKKTFLCTVQKKIMSTQEVVIIDKSMESLFIYSASVSSGSGRCFDNLDRIVSWDGENNAVESFPSPSVSFDVRRVAAGARRCFGGGGATAVAGPRFVRYVLTSMPSVRSLFNDEHGTSTVKLRMIH